MRLLQWCNDAIVGWIATGFITQLIEEVDITFKTNQGARTLVHAQLQSLRRCRNNLAALMDVEHNGVQIHPNEAGIDGVGVEGADANVDECVFHSDRVTFAGFQVWREPAIKGIMELGIFFGNKWIVLPPNIQESTWKTFAKVLLDLMKGIDAIESQNDASTGTEYPPVLPHQLVKLRSHEFNSILIEQRGRMAEEAFDAVEDQHRKMLRQYRDDQHFRNQVDILKDNYDFVECWDHVNCLKYGALREFCGGLATLFPGTASVESDFSIVNYEKDLFRASLTDFSREGILHAKQYNLVKSLEQRQI
jgi:hypothetical protein